MKELNYQFAEGNNNLLDSILDGFDRHSDVIERIRDVIYDNNSDNGNKIDKIKEIIPEKPGDSKAANDVKQLRQNLLEHKRGRDNFKVLQKLSRKLQNRVSEIIRHVDFVIRDDALHEAVLYYQSNTLNKQAPYDFLIQEEIDAVYNAGFNASLYKALLFAKLIEAIKSGDVSLKKSYRYMPIESYLIDEEFWQDHREELIEKLGLQEFADIEKLLAKL